MNTDTKLETATEGAFGLTGPVRRVDPDIERMGYAQKLILLDQMLDAATQQLCDEFGVDAQTMAAVLNQVQGRWIMSIGANVALR